MDARENKRMGDEFLPRYSSL
ncbi:hypothetical protein [Enterococcus faecium]